MATEIQDLTVKELRNLASEADIKGRSSMGRDELIEALTADEPEPEPDPQPPAPTTKRYEKVVAARRSMERAHAEVMSAERSLRSARTIMSDFKIRDAEVAKAEEDLAQARARAAKATADFQELKYGSK